MTIAYLGYLCCYEAKSQAFVDQFNFCFFFFFLNWGLNKRSRNHWNKKIATNSGNLGSSTAAFLISCACVSSSFSSITRQGAGFGLLGSSWGQIRSQQHVLLDIPPAETLAASAGVTILGLETLHLNFSPSPKSSSQPPKRLESLRSLLIPVAFHLQFSVGLFVIKSSYLQRTLE